jgi:thiol-disulfide isomerase/thioredoxin
MKKIIFVFFISILTSPLLFSQPKSERIVLFEIFTSTTCPPCVAANQYFDSWFKNACSFKSQVAIVKYHVWWPSPGNDPYYLANTSESQTRNNYYSNKYAPNGYVDGTDVSYTYSSWPALLQTRKDAKSSITISVSGSGGSNNTVRFFVKIKSDGSSIPAGQLILHCAVVESDLYYTGTNGDPVHHYVMRKMMPDAAGEQFTLTLNEEKTFTKTINWGNWKIDKSAFVAFVQNNTSKEILQAVKYDVIQITDVDENEEGMPTNYTLSQNYPNPFNPSTKIKFGLPETAFTKVSIYDVLGREVKTLINSEMAAGYHEVDFDASNLSSGIYFYRITANKYSSIKKMLLIK